VPIPQHRTKPSHRLPISHLPPSGHGLGRRLSEPALNHTTPQLCMKLHIDYLSAHSAFLRALLAGVSPLDLVTPSKNTSRSDSPSNTHTFTVPADRMPRLLQSSTPSHPVIYLPVPDPSSLYLLIHWMYFGSTEHIAEALSDGTIQWEGIARNVEYLRLPAEIKIFLGRWYANWLHPNRARAIDDDDDDDHCQSDQESLTDYESDECQTVSDSEIWDVDPKHELCRGRSTETRRLSS